MQQPTRPAPDLIAVSVAVFAVIVFIGSFHNINDAIGLATLFVGLPWLFYYFMEWLVWNTDVLKLPQKDDPHETP